MGMLEKKIDSNLNIVTLKQIFYQSLKKQIHLTSFFMAGSGKYLIKDVF